MSVDSGFIAGIAAESGLDTVAIVLRPLPGTAGPEASLESARTLYPASMIKVPIVAALYVLCAGRGGAAGRRRARRGSRHDRKRRSVAVRGRVRDHARRRGPCGDCGRATTVATNVLIDVLGRDRITAVCRDDLNLAATAVRRKLSGSLPLIDDPGANGRNAHPASDAASLFETIDRERTGRFGALYAALEAQIWNDKLAAALRPEDRFAHKTGDTDEASHDGGLLTLDDGRRFVLVVYTGLASSPESDARIARFGRTLRDALATGLANP